MSTPDEQVGGEIIARLRERRLLSETKLEKLKPELVVGSLSAEDWVLAFDTDCPREDVPK